MCRYRYRTGKIGTTGWYIADVADVRNFFKYAKKELMWLLVEISPTEYWFWNGLRWTKSETNWYDKK